MKQKLTSEHLHNVFPSLAQISDNNLAQTIIDIWIDVFEQSEWENIEEACYAPDMPQKRLVDHVNVTTEGSVQVANLIKKYQGNNFDMDRLITIGLLHDVSKLIEYAPDGQNKAKKSEYGHMLQHGVLGAFAARQHGMSTDYVHMILTHTEQCKMLPKFKEAILMSYVDLGDTDVMLYDEGKTLYLRH